MKLSLFLVFSVALLLIQCQYAKCQEGELEESTTKKPGFFSRLFGKGSSTTTTTTTTTTPRNFPAATLTPRRPSNPTQPNPNDPFGSANMGLGPYQRPKQQPSGLSLSYGPTGRPGMQPGYSAPLAPMGPIPSSPTPPSPAAGSPMSPTPVSGGRPSIPQIGVSSPASPLPSAVVPSTTTTLRPKIAVPQAPLAKVDEFADFDNHNKPALPNAISTTTTTRRPTPKEDFPALPPPRKPSIKEDFPALPSRPSSPGGQSPTPSSPTAWSTTPSSPGNRVAFVPHVPAATTTIKPGMPTTEKPLATDDEIRQLTETLYTKETNFQLNLINVNIQGKTRSIDTSDEAPQPLLQVNDKALEPPTIAKMRALFNNYELDTTVNEYVTPMEKKEENDFVDAVMATNVMRQAMLFLQSKGIVTPDPKTHRDLVKTLWFTPYSRGQGKIGSSGFEHVFVNEVKNGTIIGLHNWVYFNEEEKAGRIDYKGYLNKLDLGNKGIVLKTRFTHNGLNKPVNTLFVGTSPELELALYTVCHQVRVDKLCPVSLGGNKFGIQTYSWRYRGKNLIGSAYPEI